MWRRVAILLMEKIMFGEFQIEDVKKRIVCKQCGQVTMVLESLLPKVIECFACGWKRRIVKYL